MRGIRQPGGDGRWGGEGQGQARNRTGVLSLARRGPHVVLSWSCRGPLVVLLFFRLSAGAGVGHLRWRKGTAAAAPSVFDRATTMTFHRE